MAQLFAIQDRLNAFSEDRAASESPNYLRLHPPQIVVPATGKLEQQLAVVEQDFTALKDVLTNFSETNADPLVRSHTNAANFETLFGIGQQLFYLMYNPKDTGFTNPARLSQLMLEPHGNQLVKGLMVQRFRGVPGVGQLNLGGLTDLSFNVANHLATFKAARQLPDSLRGRNHDQVVTIHFISGLINTLVEAPIFNFQGDAVSLSDRFSSFQKIGAVNQKLDELFMYSLRGDYRYSISNLVALVDLFEVYPEPRKRFQRLFEEKQQYQRLHDNGTAYLLNSRNSQDLALQGNPLADYTISGNTSLTNEAAKLAQMHNTATSRSEQNLILQRIDVLKLQSIDEKISRLNQRLEIMDVSRQTQFREHVFRFGTFMADAAAAETPEAFEAALNTVALPPGSSQLKRNQSFSIELNAYFGVAYAQERINLPERVATGGENSVETEFGSVSLFVPIGISTSWKPFYKQKSSFTLFVPIIDIGAVTAYRIDDGNGFMERIPELNFSNVIAPGAHLFYNIPKFPLSLGFGAQYGPNTRRITPDGQPELEVSAIRYMASFSVDVPTFSFFIRR